MTATRDERLPLLAPFPKGWFFIASRQTIEKAKLLQKTWLGERIVVWCDDEERVCVAEAVCPHLGPKTLSAPPPALSLGRRDRDVSTVLRTILSG